MKRLFVLITLCTASLPLFAQDVADNVVDPSVKPRILHGCEHQMSRLTPERLAGFHVPPASFCSCVAARHVRHAKQDLDAVDVDHYLNTIIAIYAAPTADKSKPLRSQNRSVDNDDMDIANKCDQM